MKREIDCSISKMNNHRSDAQTTQEQYIIRMRTGPRNKERNSGWKSFEASSAKQRGEAVGSGESVRPPQPFCLS